VRLGGEHELVQIKAHIPLLREHQEKVLEQLGEHERIHPVLARLGAHVPDGRVAARGARVRLQLVEGARGDRQVVVVPGGGVEEVGALEELGPERVSRPVGRVVEEDGLRQEVVPLDDLVQGCVHLDGASEVALEHLLKYRVNQIYNNIT